VGSRDLSNLHPETRAIVAGRGAAQPGDPLAVPVHFASTYHAGGDVTYAREGNPSWSALEHAIGTLEGGTALVFASGMGAVSAVLSEVAVGAIVVAPHDAYTGVRVWLQDAEQHGRLELRLVDVADTAATAAACDGAALLWLETPTNPLLAIADVPALTTAAHRAGATVVVDNTFATPLLQRPLDLGADLVVHSATKFLAGHGDVLGGAVVTRDPAWRDRLQLRRTLQGASLGPMEAYLILRGMRTLGVRMERSQVTAGQLALRLQDHPAVGRVRYPGLASDPGHARAAQQMAGFGAMVSFELADADSAERVCAATQVVMHATSLGGVESTMERRRRHPHEDAVPDGLIRLSVGCEHLDDLWADLTGALEQA
jgi:cystathionine gamma-synthase